MRLQAAAVKSPLAFKMRLMKGKKNIILSLPVLLLIQLIGIVLCGWLKYCDITPLSDAMGLSTRWDFTFDFVALLLIVVPAVVAFVQRMPHWRYSIALACLPVVLLVLGMGYFIVDHQMDLHKAKLQRMAVYDSAEKIEKVIGIPFPEFKITGYEEKAYPNDLLHRYSCKASAKFVEMPSPAFYQQLDSLCMMDSKHWRRSEGIYAYDSIIGRRSLSRLVLSLLLTRGNENFNIEYDNTFNIIVNY